MAGQDRLLYSTLLKLRPLDSQVSPRSQAYRGLAMVLAILREVAPDTARELHTDAQDKPITISPLSPTKGPDPLWCLRITILDEGLFGTLADAVINWPRERPLELDGTRFLLDGLETACGKDRRVACTTYEQLLEETAEDEAMWRIRFLTPTAFRSTRNPTPFPAVPLVFGSLIRRWERFSPIHLPDRLADRLENELAIGGYGLRLARVGFGGFFEPGFTGWCTFVATKNADAEVRRWAGALSRFAYFSGVGAKTTMGMGQCWRADDRSGKP